MIEDKTKEIKRTLRIGKDGRVMKFVHEVYLRQDIGCGWLQCELCTKTQTEFLDFQDSQFLFIPDYKSLSQYYDALMSCNLRNFVISQTIAERMRKESRHLFKRFKSAVELERWRNIYVYPNEFCQQTHIPNSQQYSQDDLDELHLFKIANYFQEHFMGHVKVVLISENTNLVKKSKLIKNLECFNIRNFVQKFASNPEQIIDFLGNDLLQNLQQVIANNELKFEHDQYQDEKTLLEKTMKGQAFQGKIKFGRFNKNEASITSSILNKEIFIIGDKNINRAIHGDKVVVELLDQSQWIGIDQYQLQKDEIIEENEDQNSTQISTQFLNEEIQSLKQLMKQSNLLPTGKVIGIIKRDLRNFCGELSAQINQYGIVSLTDARYPDVIIQPRNLQQLKNKKIMINIDDWPQQCIYPIGHLVKIIGDSENVEVENEVILYEFNVDTRDFSQRVLNCLPNKGYNWTIPQEEYQKRVDLRQEFICSVDPPGCKDIDDALHAKVLPNGNIEAGVHIADVTYFVKPDTPIDQEAAERCTTVYLVNKRTDMLPKLLTESLCSLVSDVERLAFSVVWEFDSNTLEIVNCKFHKSVIKSKKAYTYEQAYKQIQDQNDQSSLTKGLRLLLKLSQNLKQKRIDQGALQLASTQVKFSMKEDDVNNPTDVSYYNLFPTNSMVEEFMLLANVSVAKKILEHFPSSGVLRKHSTPKPEHIKQLHKIMSLKNYDLDYTTSKTLADSLDKINKKNDPFFNKLVRIMTTRCMHEAIYFCSADFNPQEYRHYGLAADVYTHFTSPIRRYADVLVHRLLSASIGIESLSPVLSTKSKLVRVCDQMNIKNRNARNASRASSEFYSYLFFKNKELKESAIVASVQSNGFSVVVAKYGFEGFLEFTKNDLQKNQTIKEKNPDKALTDFYYKDQQYSLFQWLEVAITITLVQYRKKIDLVVLRKINASKNIQLTQIQYNQHGGKFSIIKLLNFITKIRRNLKAF